MRAPSDTRRCVHEAGCRTRALPWPARPPPHGNAALKPRCRRGCAQRRHQKRVRTCCRGCGKMECGVGDRAERSRRRQVEGDLGSFQSSGNCCGKSQSSIQAAYHPDRIYYPMKRTNPKGEDPWLAAHHVGRGDAVHRARSSSRSSTGTAAVHFQHGGYVAHLVHGLDAF